MEKLYTLAEITRKLKISQGEMKVYVREGRDVVREGRKVRFRLSDVEPWLAERRERQHAFAQAMEWMDRVTE